MTPDAVPTMPLLEVATPAMAAAHNVERRLNGQTLPLAVVGCDFRVGSAQWRNLLLLTETERLELTAALRVACGATGLVVLETCNRVEWLVSSLIPLWAGEVLRAQMIDRWLRVRGGRFAPDEHTPNPYVYTGRSAVRHLLRVAVGLESFVAGEREIAGQLYRALASARQVGHGSVFHNALQTALGRTVKKVERLTTWRHHGRGVHSVVLEAVTKHLQTRGLTHNRPVAIVVGMGEIGRKAADLLASQARCKVTRVNRTVPAERQMEWRQLSELPTLVKTADVVVVATGARDPIADMRSLFDDRVADQPLLVVDLGAPAQVFGQPPPQVLLMTLDDLLGSPMDAPAEEETAHVVELVEEGLREFVLECRKRSLAGLLRAVHDRYDAVAYTDLPALLANELPDQAPEDRARIEALVRNLLRNFTRDVVQHIETTAEDRGHPRGKLDLSGQGI